MTSARPSLPAVLLLVRLQSAFLLAMAMLWATPGDSPGAAARQTAHVSECISSTAAGDDSPTDESHFVDSKFKHAASVCPEPHRLNAVLLSVLPVVGEFGAVVSGGAPQTAEVDGFSRSQWTERSARGPPLG